MLCIIYAPWPSDKGAAQQVSDLVLSLRHNRLYVRFHADPDPTQYAKRNGGAAVWGQLCAERMAQYYGNLAASGVQLHAILANEVDGEAGMSPKDASDFFHRMLVAYARERPGDILHIPAPTGAPQTHREYLSRYKSDGWLVRRDDGRWGFQSGQDVIPVILDGHGYNGDLENVLNALEDECPGSEKVITETNNLDDFGWPITLLSQGKAYDIVYFILNWARGGDGRVQPPTKDDAEKRMSLLRFPDRYAQFKDTIGQAAIPLEPEPEPTPVPPVNPTPAQPDANPWEFWTAEEIAAVSGCPVDAVNENHPRLVAQLALCGINDRDVQMAVIATISVETAGTYRPVREAFWLDEAWRAANLRYYPFYGRGFVQLTWQSNYQLYSDRLDVLWGDGAPDLIADPDNALEPDVASAVMAMFFRDTRTIQGYGIVDAARAHDWEWVRRLVQGGTVGLDRLQAVVSALMGTPVATTDVVYGDDVPDDITLQRNSWSCAVRSAYVTLYQMAQKGLIEPVTYGDGGSRDVYDWLVPTFDDSSVGLHDHTGIGMVQALGAHGIRATNAYPVSLQDVQAVAGTAPIMIGGDTWGHWVYVRGLEADGTLILENPARGYLGINDQLRDSFGRLGPFAMVRVLGEDAPPVPAPGPEPATPETDQQKIERMISAIGYMGGDIADRLERARAAVGEGVPRPDATMSLSDVEKAFIMLWERVDAEYQEIGLIGAEMRRVKDQQLA